MQIWSHHLKGCFHLPFKGKYRACIKHQKEWRWHELCSLTLQLFFLNICRPYLLSASTCFVLPDSLMHKYDWFTSEYNSAYVSSVFLPVQLGSQEARSRGHFPSLNSTQIVGVGNCPWSRFSRAEHKKLITGVHSVCPYWREPSWKQIHGNTLFQGVVVMHVTCTY